MASEKAIKDAFKILITRYPAYFRDKTKDHLDNLVGRWGYHFKDIDDDKFIAAVELTIQTSRFLPEPIEVDEKIKRAEMVQAQRVTTYMERLQHLQELESATPEEIDRWVDFRRVFFEEESCTTKDFKDRIKLAQEELDKARAELSAAQRKELGIK